MSTFTFPETEFIGCKYPSYDEAPGNLRNVLPTVNAHNKEYTYRLLPGMPKPKVGDLAVVANANGVGVCVVTTLNAMTHYKPEEVAYVIGTVSTDAFQETLERAKAKKALKMKLDQKRKELEDSVTLDLLAERSPEFKDLLEAYRSLG